MGRSLCPRTGDFVSFRGLQNLEMNHPVKRETWTSSVVDGLFFPQTREQKRAFGRETASGPGRCSNRRARTHLVAFWGVGLGRLPCTWEHWDS